MYKIFWLISVILVLFSFFNNINIVIAAPFGISTFDSNPFISFRIGPPSPSLACSTDFFTCLAYYFDFVLKVIIALSLVLATIFIAWAGILYITKGSGGDKGEVHKRILWAAFGLVVALLAYTLVFFLDIWIGNIAFIFVPFVNIGYAQEINPPTPPDSIKCGDISLPSALKFTDLSRNEDIWRKCIIYYIQAKILPFLLALSLMLGTIFLAWAGILYITQPDKTKEIHSRLKWGIIGIVISLLSLAIINIIRLFFSSL
jgi:hypothetical protein